MYSHFSQLCRSLELFFQETLSVGDCFYTAFGPVKAHRLGHWLVFGHPFPLKQR